MRLKCQIDVINRNVASQGIRGGHCKPAQSTLFLAKKSGDVVFLIHCTVKDRTGVKYKVTKNIQQIFAKFISDGKATIRLKEPVVDLCIKKANPVDLRLILNALKLANGGQSISGHHVLSSMEPAKKKHVQGPPTKLNISARKDYPSSSSFPLTLAKLQVCNCRLAQFDTRMFALKNLTFLNLSSNKIKDIPTELAEMESLSSLHLKDNEVSEFPVSLCYPESRLCKNLKVLDLTNNKLTLLPSNFHNLRELVHLFLGNNGIKALPRQIGELKMLRQFSAPRNSLKMLPYSFLTMKHLEEVDLFLNPFVSFMAIQHLVTHAPGPISLQEIAARTIRQHHIFYKDSVSSLLSKYLESGVLCQCNNYCFGMFDREWIKWDLRSCFAKVTSIGTSGEYSTFVEIPLCNEGCTLSGCCCNKSKHRLKN